MTTLRIATRNSPLALWQAEHVKQCLLDLHADLDVELVSMTTEGDRFLDAPLVAIGGKGLFIKELEQAMLDDRADIAVHSMKDVTIDLPDGLQLSVIMQREDTHDALVANHFDSLAAIPDGSIVGTSSLRRQSQLRALRPDIRIRDLRGNVGTRLDKLDNGDYDAIILAAAGIKRLGMPERIAQLIDYDELLPAIGQGAIGIECRADDPDIEALIAPLNHRHTQLCVETERALSRRLFGGCQLPIAGQAIIADDTIILTALVARVDGSKVVKAEQHAASDEGDRIGAELAERLLAQGADEILKDVIH